MLVELKRNVRFCVGGSHDGELLLLEGANAVLVAGSRIPADPVTVGGFPAAYVVVGDEKILLLHDDFVVIGGEDEEDEIE